MIFIRHDDLGNIVEVVERTVSPELSAHLINITDHPLARHISNNPNKFFLTDGQLKEKTRVNLLPERLRLKADGKDIIRVKLDSKFELPIKLKIGYKEVEALPNSELEISAESLGIITISLNDPRVWGPAISLFAEQVYED